MREIITKTRKLLLIYGGYVVAFLFFFISRQPQSSLQSSCAFNSNHTEVTTQDTTVQHSKLGGFFSTGIKEVEGDLAEYGAPFMSIIREQMSKIKSARDIKLRFVIGKSIFSTNERHIYHTFIRDSAYAPDVLYLDHLLYDISKPNQLIMSLTLNDLQNIDFVVSVTDPNIFIDSETIQTISAKMHECKTLVANNVQVFTSDLVVEHLSVGKTYLERHNALVEDILSYKDKLNTLLPDYKPCAIPNFTLRSPAKRLSAYKKNSTVNQMNDFINIFTHDDDIPINYKLNEPQLQSTFNHLPRELVANSCMNVDRNSIYMIKTARNAIYERFIQRRLYMSKSNYAFFLGTAENGIGQNQVIEEEINEYDDIVIANFIDHYNALPYKTKSMYAFANNYCSTLVDKYFYHDSDAIAHPLIEELLQQNITLENSREIFLEQLRRPFEKDEFVGMWHEPMQSKEPELVCLRRTGVNRTAMIWGKYNMTNDEYDQTYTIPDYCNGQAAVINRAALELIADQALKTRLDNFRIEDIYFTGILRAKANITKITNFLRTTIDYKKDEFSSAISSYESPTFYHVEPISMTMRHYNRIVRKKSSSKFYFLLHKERERLKAFERIQNYRQHKGVGQKTRH